MARRTVALTTPISKAKQQQQQPAATASEAAAQRADFQRRAHPLAETEQKAAQLAKNGGMTKEAAFVAALTPEAYELYLAARP
jgi:hypothetical protein